MRARLYILGCKQAPDMKTRLAGLPGKIISRYSWNSPYMHIAVVDTWVGSSHPLVWEAIGEGVVHHIVEDRPYDIFCVEGTLQEITRARKWLDQQVGKKYDYFGLLGFLWRKEYQNDDKWFCSELAAEACKVGGLWLANWSVVKSWQLTPRVLLACCRGPVSIEEVQKHARIHPGN